VYFGGKKSSSFSELKSQTRRTYIAQSTVQKKVEISLVGVRDDDHYPTFSFLLSGDLDFQFFSIIISSCLICFASLIIVKRHFSLFRLHAETLNTFPFFLVPHIVMGSGYIAVGDRPTTSQRPKKANRLGAFFSYLNFFFLKRRGEIE
jgi:hypothetical protein